MSCIFANPNEDFGSKVTATDQTGGALNFEAFATPGQVDVLFRDVFYS